MHRGEGGIRDAALTLPFSFETGLSLSLLSLPLIAHGLLTVQPHSAFYRMLGF